MCAPHFAWLLWLCSRDHCQGGQTEECDPPTTILAVLKSYQKSVCETWAFKTGVLFGNSSLWSEEWVCLLFCAVWFQTDGLMERSMFGSVLGSVMEQWHHTAHMGQAGNQSQPVWAGTHRSCLTNLFCFLTCLVEYGKAADVSACTLVKHLTPSHPAFSWRNHLQMDGVGIHLTGEKPARVPGPRGVNAAAARHGWCSPGLGAGARPLSHPFQWSGGGDWGQSYQVFRKHGVGQDCWSAGE